MDAPPPNLDPHIERINAALARPWTASEKAHGRSIGSLGPDQATQEAVAAAFRREGWSVEYLSSPRPDDGCWTFKRAIGAGVSRDC
jgi:hypothetical protein